MNMGISSSPGQDNPFIANIDGIGYNFVIDAKTGLALPRDMAVGVANTQNAVNTAIEAKPETKETDPNIVELDTENYGAPPENSGIKVNVKKASLTEPQAWEDEKGNWFYNFAGALQLATTLVRTLPNIDQFVTAINANPDNFRQNVGFRDGFSGNFSGHGRSSNFWSSSQDLWRNGPYCVYLGRLASSAHIVAYLSSRGFSVRFIVDKK